ncbi:MAG: hypothetical protein VXX85_04055, partial [Candidatus Margulisiibacteriota bacterium]|nr:hypothetical protein [Candidatus Margulisiibacteriota bacterium]
MVDKNNKSLLKSSTKSNFKIAEEHTFKILNEPHCLFTKDAIFLMEQFTNGSHLTPSEFANQI